MRILRLLQKNSTARTAADQFLKADTSQEEIGKTGIALMKLMYGGTLTVKVYAFITKYVNGIL